MSRLLVDEATPKVSRARATLKGPGAEPGWLGPIESSRRLAMAWAMAEALTGSLSGGELCHR